MVPSLGDGHSDVNQRVEPQAMLAVSATLAMPVSGGGIDDEDKLTGMRTCDERSQELFIRGLKSNRLETALQFHKIDYETFFIYGNINR